MSNISDKSGLNVNNWEQAGVINIYKTASMTSFQVVAAVRRITGIKKCGHTGTLDPMAEGVLPVCLGYATRFAEYLSAADKSYTAGFSCGKAYDSYDITGTCTQSSGIVPDLASVREVFSGFQGNTSLTVPAFSAKKIDGKRAYELARKGEIEDAGSAVMRIDSVTLESYSYPDGIIHVDCGKGTYIRSIIHEAGIRLGCFAAMSSLIRTKNGGFKACDAIKLEELELMFKSGDTSALKPVGEYLDMPKAVVKEQAIYKIRHGKAPALNDYIRLPRDEDLNVRHCEDIDCHPGSTKGAECLIYGESGRLLALGIYDCGVIKLSKVFIK